ncbi:MAG: hypothetical protein WBN65_05835 [Gammaproteobacteria bacterium]
MRTLGRFSSPIAMTLVAAVILTSGYLAGEYATGGFERVWSGAEDSLGIRATATLFVLVAYLPLAHLLLDRWTARHLAALRASFGDSICWQRSASTGIGAGLLGAAIFLSLFMIIPIAFAGIPQISYQLVAAAMSGAAFGWLAGRFAACMVRESLRMSALARSLPHLDLLDLGALSPIAQQGLKSALLVALIPALSSHLSVAPGDRMIAAVAYLLIWSALTVVAFTLPVQGIHDRIRREKQSQIEKIRAEIRDASKQVVEHRSDSAGDRLSALLDLEARLERVREWPYDASSWRSFGLYLLLGLGSWIGAAAVERLLNSMW